MLTGRETATRFVVRLGAIVASAMMTAAAHADAVHLADGDSFKLGNQRYRLYGIDAPELHQDCNDASGRSWPCGTRARSELRRIIGTHPVECKARSTDRFGRIIATCTAGGRDLAEEMVRSGFASAYGAPGFSSPYEQIEVEARAEKRGMWAGTFDLPRDWRRANPRDEDLAAPRGDWLDRKLADAKLAITQWLRGLFGY